MGHATAEPAPAMLTAAERAKVRAIVEAVVPGARVAVFGSRATGRARQGSDLDLLFLDPPTLPWQARADLRDAFEASDLPFRVDLVPLASLEPAYRDRVLGEGVLL